MEITLKIFVSHIKNTATPYETLDLGVRINLKEKGSAIIFKVNDRELSFKYSIRLWVVEWEGGIGKCLLIYVF